jgi:hypothetical protein
LPMLSYQSIILHSHLIKHGLEYLGTSKI